MTVEVGFTLQPDAEFLEACAPLLSRADYFEVAPETTWFGAEDGRLLENGFHRAFRALGDRFVAHGVGYSVGGHGDDARRARWRERLAIDQRAFGYRWYTDHLGATTLAGENVALPMALPMTAETAARVRRRLREMQSITPEVGVENSVFYALLGDWTDEPAWLNEILREPRHHLLLDLHNVHTMAENVGATPDAWLSRIDLANVIEIHVSGGTESDPAWLPSGRTMRLDGHDAAVPEAVWRLLEDWAPRCPNLRGITLERMEGTVTTDDHVRQLAEELERVRRVTRMTTSRPTAAFPRDRIGEPDPEPPSTRPTDPLEQTLAALLRDPSADLDAAAAAHPILAAVDPDGLRICALLVARLRFERLLRGSPRADRAFEDDPQAFTDRFRRYHAETPMTADFPAAEAALYWQWSERAVGITRPA